MGRDDPTKLPILGKKRLELYMKKTYHFSKSSLFGKETHLKFGKDIKGSSRVLLVSLEMWGALTTSLVYSQQIKPAIWSLFDEVQSLPQRYKHDNLKSSLLYVCHDI